MNYKEKEIVTNMYGQFAKIIKIVSGVCFCTKWTDTKEKAESLKDGNCCFNERASKIIGVSSLKKQKVEEVKTSQVINDKDIILDNGDVQHIITKEEYKLNKEAFDKEGIKVGDMVELPPMEDLPPFENIPKVGEVK